MTTKKITLKAWADNNEVITVVQGEVNSRFLEITLVDNDGALNLANKSVQIYAKKPDGNIVYNNANIIDASKGIINIMLTSEMSAVSGVMSDCEIRVIDKDAVTLKFKGLHIIIKNALADTQVESSSEFTALQDLISSADAHQKLKNNPHNVTTEQIGAAKSEHTHSFSSLTSKPTTLSGYGITDAPTDEQLRMISTAVQASEKGAANGIATLDANSKLVQVPTASEIGAVPESRTINSKPLSSNIELSASDIGALPDSTVVPKKVSDLQNDSGFITDFTETDPTVPAWAKAATKPAYNFYELKNRPTTLSGYGITDAATSEQGEKANSAVQGVKCNGTIITPNIFKEVNLTPEKLGVIPFIDTISVTASDAFNNVEISLLKIGKLVVLTMPSINNLANPEQSTKLVDVPEGYRPNSFISRYHPCDAVTNMYITCGTAGAVVVTFITDSSQVTCRLGTLCWITD